MGPAAEPPVAERQALEQAVVRAPAALHVPLLPIPMGILELAGFRK